LRNGLKLEGFPLRFPFYNCWFVGFDGEFSFENIGDSYYVPYVGMRALPAIFGSLTIPVIYGIMKESSHSTAVAAFSASLVLFGEIPNSSSCTKYQHAPFS